MSAIPPSAPAPLIRLRPLSFGEILDDVFRIYRRHFGLLVGISLLLLLPTFLLQLASGSANVLGWDLSLLRNLGNSAYVQANPPPFVSSPGAATTYLVFTLLSYVVLLLAVPFLIGATAQATIGIALGQEVTIRSALRGTLRRYWALFGLALAWLPLFLCCPLLLWIGVRWAVSIPALLAEGIGPIQALGRSWALTERAWLRSLGIIIVMYLLQLAAGSAIAAFAYPIAALIPFIPEVVRGGFVLTAQAAVGAITQPLLYICIVLLYFDLRVRREAFDLDLLASQAAAGA